MEVYFADIPNIGDLSLEHVFYVYEEPILFVCTDVSGKRYLCSCCRLSENWIIRQVNETTLIDMIDNRIPLDRMFRFHDGKTLFLSWNGEAMYYSSDVPESAYPRSGSFLELSKDKTDHYRADLERQK